MTDDSDETDSLGDFVDEDFDMESLRDRLRARKQATQKNEDTDIIVQHPTREEVPDDIEADVNYIETMGLSVGPPNNSGVVTVHNTSRDTHVTERFVAFDADSINELIHALVEAKVRYDGETPEVVRTEGATKDEVKRLVDEALTEANRNRRLDS